MARRQLTWEEKRIHTWVLDHRGILSEIAVACGVTVQFVHAIAYGKSTARPGHDVEKALQRRNWPGILRRD